MGMDVYGKHPKSDEGQYFRANIWGWRVIHGIMCNFNSTRELIPEKTRNGMAFNDGSGLCSQAKCDRLADELEKIVKNTKLLMLAGYKISKGPDGELGVGFPLEDDFACTKGGRFVSVKDVKAGKIKGVKVKDLQSPYWTTQEHVLEFCKFLRACGGFEVC